MNIHVPCFIFDVKKTTVLSSPYFFAVVKSAISNSEHSWAGFITSCFIAVCEYTCSMRKNTWHPIFWHVFCDMVCAVGKKWFGYFYITNIHANIQTYITKKKKVSVAKTWFVFVLSPDLFIYFFASLLIRTKTSQRQSHPAVTSSKSDVIN